MRTVAIAGKEYEIRASVLDLLPFLKTMGIDAETSAAMSKMGEDERLDYAQTVMDRLGDPEWHYKIAFSLSRVLPTVPDHILSYSVVERDGAKHHSYVMDLEIEEIQAAYMVALRAIAEKKGVSASASTTEPPQQTREKPQGFTPQPKPSKPPAVIKPEVSPAVPQKPPLSPGEVALVQALPSEVWQKAKEASTYDQDLGVTQKIYEWIKAG